MSEIDSAAQDMNRREDWKIIDVVIALLMLALLTIVVAFILAVTDYKFDFRFNKLIFLCFDILVSLPSICYLYKKYPFRIHSVENILKIVKYSLIGLVISIIINIPLIKSPDDIPAEYDFLLRSNILTKSIYLLFACFVAPVIEEVFFRGLIYRILKHRYDIVTAIVLGTGIFILVHAFGGYDGDLFVLAIAGLLFIYVYEKSGSLLTSMITHALYNSVWFYFIHLGVQ